ncbi:MAG: hypothetical protein MMC33_008203 [Icmadophila ericetorum]|nr:hypothetical protein [Icmadophila ericetorum]
MKPTESTIPSWVNPNLDALLELVSSNESFKSYTVSKVSLPAGALFARITGITQAPSKTYGTVQAGPNLHIELNSNLLYIDHSCDPSLEFDMTRFEVRVNKNRPLRKGDKLSFFYPSSEWSMAQPFECRCGAGKGVCLGKVEGAERLDEGALSRYWLNDHIKDLIVQRKSRQSID